MSIWDAMKKKTQKKKVRPSVYDTMPHYFPTEQVDIVNKKEKVKKLKKIRRIRRKS